MFYSPEHRKAPPPVAEAVAEVVAEVVLRLAVAAVVVLQAEVAADFPPNGFGGTTKRTKALCQSH